MGDRKRITNALAARDFVRRNVEEIRSCRCVLCKNLLRLVDNHDGLETRREFVTKADAAARQHGWK